MDMMVAAREGRDVPVLFADDVGVPEVDGPYIRIRVYQCGMLVVVVSFTATAFYAALEKVMDTALPATGDAITH